MWNRRSFSSLMHGRDPSRPCRRALSALAATLLCVIPMWAGGATQSGTLDIASAPLFLLSGAPPNLILTIDDSNSMNQASLPEGIWGAGGGSDPQLDARDTSSLTNRQYYDPAQTYLPPKAADGLDWPHAGADVAQVDAFDPNNASCKTLDLRSQYAPVWSLEPDGDKACADLTATDADAIKNYYSVDGQYENYAKFAKGYTPCQGTMPEQRLLCGKAWAWRCMVSGANDCPAIYYRLRQDGTYTAAELKCNKLNLATIKPSDFPPECLERVKVGSDEDFSSIHDRKNEDVTDTIRANRRNLLKNKEGTIPGDQALAWRNFANWFSYYRTRFLTLKTVLSRVFNDLPATVRFGYQSLPVQGQYLAGTQAFDTLAARFEPYRDNRTAFFDWLFPLRATSKTYLVSAAARVHEFCGSDQAYLDDPLSPWDATNNPLRGCRNNFHVMFTDGYWEDTIRAEMGRSGYRDLAPPNEPTGNAHLWLGNNDATRTYLPADSPAIIALGRSVYEPIAATHPTTSSIFNVFRDGNEGMLADVVFASWITDLRPLEPAAENLVPPLSRVPQGSTETAWDFFWNPANDPADWQHITTYTIGLGVAGEVLYPEGTWNYNGASGTLKADGFPGNWNAIGETAGSANAEAIPATIKIDDGWHAGINGRGDYLSAGDAAALTKAFSAVLTAVTTVAKDSSAAAAAVNTGTTASQDTIYQSRLNSKDWSGDVRSFQVSAGKGNQPCPDQDILPGQLCQDPSKGQYYRSAADATQGRSNRDRRIFTAARGRGVQFSWTRLTDTQKRDFLMGADPKTAKKNQIDEAKARLDYVAGDKQYEVDGRAFRFRTRPLIPPCTERPKCTNLLGDFINAAPVLVGPPAFYYNAPGYQNPIGKGKSYTQQHKDRTKLVYAGANDGMLHAFYADTLKEAFAFIPPVLMGLDGVKSTQVQRPGLHVLSEPAYGGSASPHRNFVDGPIATGDVRFGAAVDGNWHTVVLGGLGLGAQALYALDVTKVPADGAAVSTFAGSMYLWQFTDRDDATTGKDYSDPSLGYVLWRPAIVRVRGSLVGRSEPTWVVITGNGYNSSDDDGSRAAGCDDPKLDTDATACGQAVLYVIEIETGRVIDPTMFATGVGRKDDPLYKAAADADKRRSNGLGQPTVVTSSVVDGDIIADFAYAADLFGNVYRFDLTGTSTKPIRTLFSATDTTAGSAQPTTSPIAVARHPLGLGTLVLFGTGKYLERADPSDRQVQSFYGIWDSGDDDQKTVLRSTLLEQEFIETNIIVQSGEGASKIEVTRGRTSTNRTIDWSTQLGWYIDFDIEKDGTLNKGERLVTEPEIQGNRVVFVSLVPENNPCAGGGYSWINALDLRSGARLGTNPFDYNLDGTFAESDLLVTKSGDKVVGTSVRLTPGGKSTGIYSSPSSLGDGAGRVTTVVSTSDGDLALINAFSIQGWRVWQQLQ